MLIASAISMAAHSWKFQPTTMVRLESNDTIVAFLREFISYLHHNVNCKNEVKAYFDKRCKEVPVMDRYSLFFPENIFKQCILVCSNHDALCRLISLGDPPMRMDMDRKLAELARLAGMLLQNNRSLYRVLCSSLDIKVAVGFSLVSPEPYVPPSVSGAGNAEPAAPRFVPRGGGEREGINTGLKEDRQSFINFISQQPYAWYSSISDKQENVILPQGDMRSKKQIEEFINVAHLTNLPEGSEVIIYFAGHGQEDTGDWGAYKDEAVLSLHVTMEKILDLWIGAEKDKDPADYLHLTIISDCCFSNKWVQRLKEDIEKGVGSKYGRYPICIQGAASEDAYENTLLALLFPKDGVLPLCAGQDPKYKHTLAYQSPVFQNRLISKNDYEALFNPGTVPSRRGLTRASGQKGTRTNVKGSLKSGSFDCVAGKAGHRAHTIKKVK